MEAFQEGDLVIEHRGWLLIDQETVRVSGAIAEIVGKMQCLLQSAEVFQLCVRLGIDSAGFLFQDVFKSWTKFFREQGPPLTYSTPYIWSTEEKQARWSPFVHALFVRIREAQQDLVKPDKARTEDYFSYIPHDPWNDTSFCEQERSYRKELGLHYCTLGEMAFTMAAWRILRTAEAQGRSAVPIAALPLSLSDPCEQNSYRWLGRDLLRPMGGSTADAVHRTDWSEALPVRRSLGEEWGELGLARESGPAVSAIRVAFIRFIGALNVPETSFIPEIDDAALLRLTIAALPAFFRHLGCPATCNTVADCSEMFERKARFPVPAFYAWQLLDGVPRSYLVSPVWTSQKYTVRTEHGTCRHLGLALCAVRPLSRIDWTLPEQTVASRHVSAADPIVISNVLKLMARPLVEGSLYDTAVREVIGKTVSDVIETTAADRV